MHQVVYLCTGEIPFLYHMVSLFVCLIVALLALLLLRTGVATFGFVVCKRRCKLFDKINLSSLVVRRSAGKWTTQFPLPALAHLSLHDNYCDLWTLSGEFALHN